MRVALNVATKTPRQQGMPYRHECGAVLHYLVLSPTQFTGPEVCYCGEIVDERALTRHFKAGLEAA